MTVVGLRASGPPTGAYGGKTGALQDYDCDEQVGPAAGQPEPGDIVGYGCLEADNSAP
jgi:hypothetical protein